MSTSMQEKVKDILYARGWTLGFAESCTGGLISYQAVEIPDISSVYKGAIVCYSSLVKQNVLRVPSNTIQTHGVVSAPVAKLMAEGAKEVLDTTVALSVTGLAGPAGGTASKPVGLVFIAVVGPGFEKVERHIFTGSNGETLSRDEIQRQTAIRAWALLNEVLKN